MAELNINSRKKVIAYYLPQYHAIPENDKWWGKGFTEWTNTKKAVPQFEGHYQPKTPLNDNYYDLNDVSVMEWQAKLAKKYGVYGFCYYHYWFKGGKKLLEMPVEQMLADPKVDIPFCLSWANENWTRNWDGGNKEVIAEQDYGDKEDWEKHFLYLLNFFKDPRYITFDGCPVLFVYKPELIDCFNSMVDYWKKRVAEEGFPGIKIVCQFPNLLYSNDFNIRNFDKSRVDYFAKFEPASEQSFSFHQFGLTQWQRQVRQIKHMVYRVWDVLKKKFNLKGRRPVIKGNGPLVCDYDQCWNVILNREPCLENVINGGFVDWDNTARNKAGRLYVGSVPEKFEEYMTELLKKPSALNVVTVNAWNEWAEGAYLEPDTKHEYGYLEALKNAIHNAGEAKL